MGLCARFNEKESKRRKIKKWVGLYIEFASVYRNQKNWELNRTELFLKPCRADLFGSVLQFATPNAPPNQMVRSRICMPKVIDLNNKLLSTIHFVLT